MAITQRRPAEGGDPPFRSRMSVHGGRVPQALPGRRRDAVDGIGWRRVDNAIAEGFFASLERELLNRRQFKTQAEAKMGGCSNGSKFGITLIDVIPRSGIDRRSTMSVRMDGQTDQTRASTAFGGTLRM